MKSKTINLSVLLLISAIFPLLYALFQSASAKLLYFVLQDSEPTKGLLIYIAISLNFIASVFCGAITAFPLGYIFNNKHAISSLFLFFSMQIFNLWARHTEEMPLEKYLVLMQAGEQVVLLVALLIMGYLGFSIRKRVRGSENFT